MDPLPQHTHTEIEEFAIYFCDETLKNLLETLESSHAEAPDPQQKCLTTIPALCAVWNIVLNRTML